MILPSDNWCTMRYFTTTYENQGTKVRTADYQKAFQEDVEIGPVISKIGALLTDHGYSIKSAEQEIKTLNTRIAEDNVTISKTSGANLAESPLDVLKRRIKSDILIQINWTINSDKSTTFILESFDTYSSKQIASSTSTTPNIGENIQVQLEKAVNQNIKKFCQQMDVYYTNQCKAGREIVLTVKIWNNWDKDLETEYDGEELTDIIQDWVRKNTVRSAYNMTDGTESFIQFEQVMIPLFDDSGKSMDARAFATKLRKFLNASPFNISCKVMQRGLGEAIIVLGEK